MSMQDPVADMLTRIRNAQIAAKKTVSMPSSKLKAAIANVLKDEGYIKGFDVDGDVKKTLTVELKYHNQAPVIENIKRISRPGLRIYKNSCELPRPLNGMGIAIVSTPNGVMSDGKARAAKVGGEVICEVY